MYTVHLYDFKDKKKFETPLNDPFNISIVIGRFEAYDAEGNFVLSSGKRRVKNLANYPNSDGTNNNFLPLQLLKRHTGNASLNIKDRKAAPQSRFSAHLIVMVG